MIKHSLTFKSDVSSFYQISLFCACHLLKPCMSAFCSICCLLYEPLAVAVHRFKPVSAFFLSYISDVLISIHVAINVCRLIATSMYWARKIYIFQQKQKNNKNKKKLSLCVSVVCTLVYIIFLSLTS